MDSAKWLDSVSNTIFWDSAKWLVAISALLRLLGHDTTQALFITDVVSVLNPSASYLLHQLSELDVLRANFPY